jgi:tail lysozyme
MRGFAVAKSASLAFVVVAAVGCVGQPPVEEETTEALATAFANDKPAYDFFVGKGLTNFQAAGIVGNLDQESGVNPSAVQYGGGPGRGIAQWSVGGRWDTSSPNAVAFAQQKGESVYSLNLQLEFIWDELTTVGYGYSALKATTNVTDATLVFMDKYEICGTCVSTQRISYAKSVLAAYGAAPPYAATFVSQTWPYASQPAFKIKCSESIAAKIVLKNTGSKTWDTSTRLGTTMKRDRASIFAGSDWVSPSRAAEIKGTVAPGADGTFAFSWHGPTGAACVPGTYKEYFGVVQENVAWFSDGGQGGPPDDQLEALIELVPGDATPPDDMGNNGGGTGGGGTGGTPGDNGGTTSPGDPGTGGNGEPGDGAPPGTKAGCTVGGTAGGDGALLGFVLIGLWLCARARRFAR